MLSKCWSTVFYTLFLFISKIECLQKTRGKRAPQSAWLYDQQDFGRDGSQSTNNEQTNNNSFEFIVFEAPTDNQSHSNIYESAGPQSITLQEPDKIQLLSLLFDGKQQPQNRLQVNVPQENFKPPPLKLEPKFSQPDVIKWDTLQPNVSIKNEGPPNTERDLTFSDTWKPPPQTSDSGPSPTAEPEHFPLNNRKPPHLPPSNSWRPPPPYYGGRIPPSKFDYSPFYDRKPPPPLPPSDRRFPAAPEPDYFPFSDRKPPHPSPWNGRYRERRGPPPHARGRGPTPHARGRGPPPHARGRGPPPQVRGHGPPHKEFDPPRSHWESYPDIEGNFYDEQSDSKTKTITQREKSTDKTNRQDPVDSNSNNAVYDRNQGRGVPLTISQSTADKIPKSRPQPHLFQVVAVTPEK